MTEPSTHALPATGDALHGGLSDSEIVARIRAGDVATFETVFRAYWDQLYRFADRYLASPDESDEAVQTVFARIWRSRDDLNVRGPLAAYLYLATRNACRDQLKYAAASASRNALFADARPRSVEAAGPPGAGSGRWPSSLRNAGRSANCGSDTICRTRRSLSDSACPPRRWKRSSRAASSCCAIAFGSYSTDFFRRA